MHDAARACHPRRRSTGAVTLRHDGAARESFCSILGWWLPLLADGAGPLYHKASTDDLGDLIGRATRALTR